MIFTNYSCFAAKCVIDHRCAFTEETFAKHISNSKCFQQLALIYRENMLKVSLFLPDGVSLLCHPSPFVHFLSPRRIYSTFKKDKSFCVKRGKNKLIYLSWLFQVTSHLCLLLLSVLCCLHCPQFKSTPFPHGRCEPNCSVVFELEDARVPIPSRKVWNKENTVWKNVVFFKA